MMRSRKRSNGSATSSPEISSPASIMSPTGNSLPQEMRFQRSPLARRIAEPEGRAGFRREAAPVEIGTRAGAGAPGEARLEETRGDVHHIGQAGAALGALDLLRRRFRNVDPGHAGQPLHRLREGDALGFHQETEDVAVLSA